MSTSFPFLTTYDPPGTSEGSLDPLGLYQIADQLAVQLVPAVRERMQRIRFLTAMAVGAMVTEELDDDPSQGDAAPCFVWEWMVVEALMRSMGPNPDADVQGVPGSLVARRALGRHGYLDARSYLKTPRIFGFHGVYKRLAIRLGIVDVHLSRGPNAEGLVDAWARGVEGAGTLLSSWSAAIRGCLKEKPPRTPSWTRDEWTKLAQAFAPAVAKTREKRYLRDLLLVADDRRLGALPSIWALQPELDDEEFAEETLHDRLEKREPVYAPLLQAIRAYEAFARSLQDGFDVLKAEAARHDAQGFVVPDIPRDEDFVRSVKRLHNRFDVAHSALGEVTMALQSLFDERFRVFAEPMDPAACAITLCTHHETVQRGKSADGKRPWFDRVGPDRIYVRHAYREPRRDILPGRYVHDYRGRPIRSFHRDLS